MKNKKWKIGAAVVGLAFLLPITYGYLHTKNFAVLSPAGPIAAEQKHLLGITLLLGIVVIIPVYFMLFFFAWKYRASNKKATYSPHLKGNVGAEIIWWGIPIIIIGILSTITWRTSHALDPHKSLHSSVQPLTVQVVALDWKWLFIYPEQGVGSINEMHMRVGQPVNFEITADAPMNSFWIPQLGSQIYAMPGMSSKLHLRTDKPGDYRGSSANISGAGFADMHFVAKAGSDAEFQAWVQQAKHAHHKLDATAYDALAKQRATAPVSQYSNVDSGLYHSVLMKYMGTEAR